MKLTELGLNPVAKVRESTNFAIREIKKVCKNIGPRAPGSESENKAQDYIAENCAKFADVVEKETFKLSPRAFMAWPWLVGILILLSSVLYQLGAFDVVPSFTKGFYISSLAIIVLSLILIVFEFLLYKPLLDPFFRKSVSSNVLLIKKPKCEVLRRIVFSGHVDSSYEWRYTYSGGAKLLLTVVISSFIVIALCLAASIVSVVLRDIDGVLLLVCRIVMGVAGLFVIVGILFENGKVVVEGANDNLTGVFASIAVLQFLKTNNIDFENTEVIAVSTGSEESGLRGAKALVKKHADEYNKVETVFIGTDTLRDLDYMGIFTRDMTGTVKLDPQAAALLKKASEMSGLDLPYLSCFFGSSDAAAMMQGGVKSALLAAMDPSPARYYHTRLDNASNLDPKTIEKGIEILINAALLFDEQGLKDNYD